ncbi:MAG: molybdopterin guanine dinucleotide-containing S/N-oxide reductase [Dongiaceae bacterium]
MSGRVPSSTHWGAVEAIVEGGRLAGVAPFAADRDPSPIIASLPGAVHHPTRIATPAVRAGWLARGPAGDRAGRGAEPFVAVSWERALDLVAGELRRVARDHGNPAIYAGSYGWGSAGRFHDASGQLHRLLNLIGGYTGSVNSYSCAAAIVTMPHVVADWYRMFHEMTDWRAVAEASELVVALGGLPLRNAQVIAGGSGSHDTAFWLARCRERGVAFVNVGPIAEDMAGFLAAEWLPAVPNSDVALMLGLAHTLVEEGRHDEAFLARYCVGFERFRPYLMGTTDGVAKSADWAAPLCGLPAETIRALARRMAGCRSLLVLGWSLQRADHGEQVYWMAVTLAAMLGQIGLPGGGFAFGLTAVGNAATPADRASRAWLPEGVNPTGSVIPVARVADMLLAPGTTIDYDGRRITYPDIRLVYWCGGNPFHHHQDLNRLLAAWRRPETIVVHEPWWTPLARHADIVLPATTTFERNDIGGASRDPWMLAMHQAIPPVGEARSDHAICAALARRLGVEAAFTEGRDEMAWLRHLYERDRQEVARLGMSLPTFEAFWAQGHALLPVPERPGVLLEAFRRDPEAHPLTTPSGRIEIFSERVAGFGYRDCPGHPVWLEPAEWRGSARAASYPLHLISNQPAARLHSQLDQGSVSLAAKIAGREPVWIHPADAAERAIADGQVVRVFNDRGTCLAGARVTGRIARGVVQLATGAWYDPERPGEIGSLCKHGNVNLLTLDKGTSSLAQGPSAQTCLVEIEPHAGEPPPVTAFDPPLVLDSIPGELSR